MQTSEHGGNQHGWQVTDTVCQQFPSIIQGQNKFGSSMKRSYLFHLSIFAIASHNRKLNVIQFHFCYNDLVLENSYTLTFLFK